MAGPKRPVRNYWGAGQFGGRLRVVGQTVICGKSKVVVFAQSFFAEFPRCVAGPHCPPSPRLCPGAGRDNGLARAQPCTWRALRGPDRHKGAVGPQVFVQRLGGRLGGVFGGAQGWRQEIQGDHAAARKHVLGKHRRGDCVRLPEPVCMRTRPRPRPTKQGPVPASRVQVLLPGQGVCVVRFHNPTGWFYSSQVKVRYALSAGPTLSPDAARPKKPPPPPPPPKSPPVAVAAAALPTAAEAPSAAEEPAAATPTPKALSPEMGAALSRQLARRPSLDEVTSSSSRPRAVASSPSRSPWP